MLLYCKLCPSCQIKTWRNIFLSCGWEAQSQSPWCWPWWGWPVYPYLLQPDHVYKGFYLYLLKIRVGQMESSEKTDYVGERWGKGQEEQRHGNRNKYGYRSGSKQWLFKEVGLGSNEWDCMDCLGPDYGGSSLETNTLYVCFDSQWKPVLGISGYTVLSDTWKLCF